VTSNDSLSAGVKLQALLKQIELAAIERAEANEKMLDLTRQLEIKEQRLTELAKLSNDVKSDSSRSHGNCAEADSFSSRASSEDRSFSKFERSLASDADYTSFDASSLDFSPSSVLENRLA